MPQHDGEDVAVLDIAHTAMMNAPDDDAARLRYYACLADCMLYLMLEAEVEGDDIRPQLLETEDGPVVLAFDREERLAEAAGMAVAYAELPGRVIAAQLAGQGVALGINLGAADAAFLVPPDALIWLSQTLMYQPTEAVARPVAFDTPRGLPEGFLNALRGKLGKAGGLADGAFLVAVRYEDGRLGHMLAFIGATSAAQPALTRAAAEALTFSGIDAAEIDVTFLMADAPAATRIARTGLSFDMAKPVAAVPVTPSAPGMDPTKPPIIR